MTGADDHKAGAVILGDLTLFNRAVVFFETQIDPLIRTEIEQVVMSWLKDRSWLGETEVSDTFEGLSVAPPQWKGPDKNDWYAWFQFGRRTNSDTESIEIAELFGAGQADWGFRFEVDHAWFGGKKAWNTYANGQVIEFGQQLNGRGWIHEGKGVFFRPVVLTTDKLVAAWENEDWAEVLMPLERALDALMDDLPIFDAIVNMAKAKFLEMRPA